MSITVTYNNITLGKASQEDFDSGKIVNAEGNYYFDQSLIRMDLFVMKGDGQQYTCPIKQGTCDYYNLVIDGKKEMDEISWIYEHVDNTLFKQIEGKMAFYKQKVQIIEN